MLAEKPIVSVIVLSYNSEKTIKKTIDSILYQKGAFGLEIIVMDDGSNDKTLDVIRQIRAENAVEIKIISNDRSDGVCNVFERINHSLHKGLEMATGEYVRTIAGDDYFYIDSVFEKQLEILESNKQYIACTGKFYWGYLGDRLVYKKAWNGSIQLIDRDEYIRRGCYIHSSTLLIRNIFTEHKQEWELLSYDDVGMMLLLLKVGKVAMIDEFISVYSQEFISVFHGFENGKWLSNCAATITACEALKPIYGDDLDEIIVCMYSAARGIYRNRKRFWEIVDEEWKQIFKEKNCVFLDRLSGNYVERILAGITYIRISWVYWNYFRKRRKRAKKSKNK